MNIFQIFLCDEEWASWNLSTRGNVFKDRKQVISKIYNDCNYSLYTNEMAESFLSEFDREVFNAYTKLRPYAYRADLLRYCLLYKFGGWYFDLSTVPFFQYYPDKDCLLFVNVENRHAGRLIENCILYSKPNSLFFEKVIKKTVANIKSDNYSTTLHITGPGLLYQVFLNDCDTVYKKSRINFGKVLIQNKKNHHYIDQTLFSIRDKDNRYDGSLDFLGFKGTNNYHTLFHQKQIYNK